MTLFNLSNCNLHLPAPIQLEACRHGQDLNTWTRTNFILKLLLHQNELYVLMLHLITSYAASLAAVFPFTYYSFPLPCEFPRVRYISSLKLHQRNPTRHTVNKLNANTCLTWDQHFLPCILEIIHFNTFITVLSLSSTGESLYFSLPTTHMLITKLQGHSLKHSLHSTITTWHHCFTDTRTGYDFCDVYINIHAIFFILITSKLGWDCKVTHQEVVESLSHTDTLVFWEPLQLLYTATSLCSSTQSSVWDCSKNTQHSNHTHWFPELSLLIISCGTCIWKMAAGQRNFTISMKPHLQWSCIRSSYPYLKSSGEVSAKIALSRAHTPRPMQRCHHTIMTAIQNPQDRV